MTSEVLWVDNSTLVAQAQCTLRQLLRYQFHYTTPEASLPIQAGEALHTAQEAYYKTNDPTVALETFQKEYADGAEAADPEGDTARLTLANTSAIYTEWLDTHPMRDGVLYNASGLGLFRVDPDYVEIGVQVPLDEGVMYYGRLDAIVSHLDTGHWMVNDHKSTGNLSSFWAKKFLLGSQLSLYTWAAQQHTEQMVLGGIITAIEFSKLPGSDRKCSRHGMTYAECGIHHAKFEVFTVDRSERNLAKTVRQARYLATQVRASREKFPVVEVVDRAPTEGEFNDACSLCEFNKWCVAGRDVRQLDADFIVRPWRPYEPKEEVAA